MDQLQWGLLSSGEAVSMGRKILGLLPGNTGEFPAREISPEHEPAAERMIRELKAAICSRMAAREQRNGGKRPMKWMLNMTDCSGDVERFRDGADAAAYLRHLGFDGFELMHLPGGDPSFFPEGSVGGIHLNYWYDWLDLWLGEEQALKEEYGSLQAAEEIYGALDAPVSAAVWKRGWNWPMQKGSLCGVSCQQCEEQ